MSRLQPLRPEKRRALRLDKVFPVWISSNEYGEQKGVARNISAGGIFIETQEPMPLGAPVRVHFVLPDGTGGGAEIVAIGEVKNHYFLNYVDEASGPRSMAGMGVRFLSFELDGEDSLARGLSGYRVLH